MEYFGPDNLKHISEKVECLFKNKDYLSLINYSKQKEFQELLEYSTDFESLFGLICNNCIIELLECLIRTGIAYFELGKFKNSIYYFEFASEVFSVFKYLIECIKNTDTTDDEDLQTIYKILTENFINKNNILEPTLYKYIGKVYFYLKDYNTAINTYDKALKLTLSDNSLKMSLLMCKAEACYELTKRWITLGKIIFFALITAWFIFINRDFVFSFYSNIFTLFHNVLWYILVLLITSVLPVLAYNLFYFILRKIRKFLVKYLLAYFPDEFKEWLIHIRNKVTLKDVVFLEPHWKSPFVLYREFIKCVEEIGHKDFDTFFAIARLYYYLGEYKNATLYVQQAIAKAKDENGNTCSIFAAIAYHYLARIAYKTGNNSTAINFYDKVIEFLMDHTAEDKDSDVHPRPVASDMVKYVQDNRTFIENALFCRTYLPLIITMILTIIVGLAQIYYSIDANQLHAQTLFNRYGERCQHLVSNKQKKVQNVREQDKDVPAVLQIDSNKKNPVKTETTCPPCVPQEWPQKCKTGETNKNFQVIINNYN